MFTERGLGRMKRMQVAGERITSVSQANPKIYWTRPTDLFCRNLSNCGYCAHRTAAQTLGERAGRCGPSSTGLGHEPRPKRPRDGEDMRDGLALSPFEPDTIAMASAQAQRVVRGGQAGLTCRKRSRHTDRVILSPGARATPLGNATQLAMPRCQSERDKSVTLLAAQHRSLRRISEW